MEIPNKLVFAEPGSQTAKDLLADVYGQIGYQKGSPGVRNSFIAAACELRSGMPAGAPPKTSGLALADNRRDGPRTFLGLLVSGSPNLVIVNGPHNAAALCNAGRCIERNVDWIARCINFMRTQNLTRVEPGRSGKEQRRGWPPAVQFASGLNGGRSPLPGLMA